MKLRDTIFFLIISSALIVAPPCLADGSGNINPKLSATLQSATPTELIEALIILRDNEAIGWEVGKLARRQPDLRSRYQTAYHQLQDKTKDAQAELARILENKLKNGQIAEYKQYWITNAVSIIAPAHEIEALAKRYDVAEIIPNMTVGLIKPVALANAVAGNGVADNILAVGARALWDRGLTGKGRLICSFDTGVEGTHPAVGNQWRGKSSADTAACWFDPYGSDVPVDESGHGTHVMGIMVGHDGADTIGLAPDAEWICAAVIDRGALLQPTIYDILDAFEWAANPDGDPQTTDDLPDVVCNSWGIPKDIIDPCAETFWNAIDNLESLGIVCVFAAGNEGPNSETMRNPAGRASSPYNSFAVGAVDAATPGYPVASFSSRGPSSCDFQAKKPEVVAPGVSIRSAYKNNSYKLISGSSMAVPHVAAAVALFRQYNPNLTPEEIKSALLQSAIDIADPGEDNKSGKGFIDLAAALELLPAPTIPDPQVEDVIFTDASNNLLDPGDNGQLSLTIRAQVTDAFDLVGYLSTTRPGIQITKDTALFGTILQNNTGDNSADPFLINTGPGFVPGDEITFSLILVGEGIPGYLQREFTLQFGVPFNGRWAALDAGSVQMTVSNFGLYGLHNNSYVPLGGYGYDIPTGGGNFLFEAGLVIKAGTGPVADGIRTDGLGTYNGDFKPVSAVGMGLSAPGEFGDLESDVTFNDNGATFPLGITVRQRAAAFATAPQANCILLEWKITNDNPATLADFCVGLFTDWDLPGDYQADLIVVDEQEDLFYQHRDGASPIVGVVLLNAPLSATGFFTNESGKRGFSEFEKLNAISGGINIPDESAAADWCGFVGAELGNLSAGDSVTLAVALCWGQNMAEFYLAAAGARDAYHLTTGIAAGEEVIPEDYQVILHQNYPNPFNPQTRIEYELSGSGRVEVEVFNILGQKIKTLFSGLSPVGRHTVIWNGTDHHGRQVASGVYLYRVSTKTSTRVRKMMLVR